MRYQRAGFGVCLSTFGWQIGAPDNDSVGPPEFRAGTPASKVNADMNVIGGDLVRSSLESDGYYFKLILNESAAHFFPFTTEHRDATQVGLCYGDDSLGNALAATIKPKRIDIRFHRAFTDQRVTSIVERLLEQPDAQLLAEFAVYYQGRILIKRQG